MTHNLKVDVTLQLDLVVPTGTGPELAAAAVAQIVTNKLPDHLGVEFAAPPETVIGAWRLDNGPRQVRGKDGMTATSNHIDGTTVQP